MLEVRRTGGKTFYLRYRDAHGRERQFKIGSAHVLTISQARRKARAVLAEAILGHDRQRQREELRSIPTLAEFIDESYMPCAKNVKRSWQTDDTILRIHILRKFGALHLDEISNQAIADLLSRMRDQGYASGTVNRMLILLRFVFNLARKWGIPGSAENPTAGSKTAPDVCRERFLAPFAGHRTAVAVAAFPVVADSRTRRPARRAAARSAAFVRELLREPGCVVICGVRSARAHAGTYDPALRPLGE